MGVKRYNSRELSNHLRELAAHVHDMDKDGVTLTRGEALARLLWNKALGYEETVKDDEGNEIKTPHPPEAWAIQLIYERMEGKSPQAIAEDDRKLTALAKVRELAVGRINALAGVAGGPPKVRGSSGQ